MSNKDKLKGMILGMVTGAIAGIMLAPKSGKETREQLEDKYLKAREKFSKKLSEVKEITQDTYEKIVDEVVSDYEKDQKLDHDEAQKLKQNLKVGYHDIKKKLKE